MAREKRGSWSTTIPSDFVPRRDNGDAQPLAVARGNQYVVDLPPEPVEDFINFLQSELADPDSEGDTLRGVVVGAGNRRFVVAVRVSPIEGRQSPSATPGLKIAETD